MGIRYRYDAVGTSLGFAPGKSLTYDASADGVGGAWDAVTNYTARKRARGAQSVASIVFDDDERRAARGSERKRR